MPKTVDTTGLGANRNSSDSKDAPVPILDDESELLRQRIKLVVGDRPVRAFARAAKVGESSLRDYLEGRRSPKRNALEKIAFEGRVSTEWLITGVEPKQHRGVIWSASGAGKTASSALVAMQYLQAADGDNVAAGQINVDLLRMCLLAAKRVFGEEFANALDIIRLEYAADFYNQLALMVKMKGPSASLGDMCKLDVSAMADQLRLFVQMGWVRNFPADPNDTPRPGHDSGTW